ncbi:hypothetical protein [Cyclobacterium xiamenense]|uniref:hypothetical protein n=1 Tax=Cyclobacterium xiamenense TaxID=1297121 RepID=UPI0035D0EDC1
MLTKRILWITALLCWPALVRAQYESVVFSAEKNQLNAGLPLPSETPFYLEGSLPEGVKRVEVKVFKSKKTENQADFYYWKAPYLRSPTTDELFVAYPLRSSENYTLKFYFYSASDKEETRSLQEALHENLESYIQASILAGKRGTETLSRPAAMLDHLNEIVWQGLKNFQHPLDQEFEGFSDVVKQKITQLDRVKLKQAEFNLLAKKNGSGHSGSGTLCRSAKTRVNQTPQSRNDPILAKPDVDAGGRTGDRPLPHGKQAILPAPEHWIRGYLLSWQFQQPGLRYLGIRWHLASIGK